MHANDRKEIKEVRAGDIAAAVGLKDVTTGETLCAQDKVITLERMEFPEPVISVAVEPKTKADQDKMGAALGKLAQEDPSFRVHTDEESGQTIISGMGELHLEIIVDRMRREFGVEANVGAPRGQLPRDHPRQGRARGQVRPSVRRSRPVRSRLPADRAAGSRGRVTSSSMRWSAGLCRRSTSRRWTRGSARPWPMASSPAFPVVDVRVALYDGSYHDVDSSEMAFKIAGSMGFREGIAKARPVLLEPIMKVEVVTPEDFMGDVMGDLNSRRGMIHGMEDAPSGKIVRAEVPLAQMFGYSTDLRSATQGRATYSMEFAKIQPRCRPVLPTPSPRDTS